MPDWRWKNFKPSDMTCKETGEVKYDPSFMDRLQTLREQFGKPMSISSGYRSPKHPIEARKAKPGAHASGRAVDVRVSGADALRLVELALGLGFTGIGVSQKAGKPVFIHLDDLPPGNGIAPRPNIWSY